MSTPTCAKVIYWRARPGQFDAYTDYLRNEVEPIDHAAQREGVLARFAMLPDGQARAQRAQRASALRDKVGEVDMDLLG